MPKCAKCGGKLQRIHRTFLERFEYQAIYLCTQCEEEHVEVRRYRYHFGEHSRCPRCGTYKLNRLKRPDKIDPMIGGFCNLLERILGDNRLYHCRFCRIQFYDRRMNLPPGPAAAEAYGYAHQPESRSGVFRS